MPSYKTPARGRWARFNTTGDKPSILAPGAMAVNWEDRKVYVGGPGANPVLFSHALRDHDNGLHYYPGDIALLDGALIRCLSEAPPGTGISDAYWEVIGGAAGTVAHEAAITGITSGGAMTLSDPTTVAISAGEGVIVDNSQLFVPSVTQVSWGGISLAAVDPGEQWLAIGIDSSGSVTTAALSAVGAAWRRNNILLGAALWDDGEITLLEDLTTPAGTMSETVRDAFFANGGPYRASGLRPSYNPGGFELTLTAGTVFDMGVAWRSDPDAPNTVDVAAMDPVEFTTVLRDAVVATGVTDVPQFRYDSGGGTPTLMSAGEFTIHYIFAKSDFSQIYLQYGQTVYGSATGAASALPDDYDSLVPFAAEGLTILVGAVIVGFDDTALSAGRVISALNEPTPFTGALAQDTADFFFLDGSRPMAGPIDMAGFDIDMDGGELLNGVIQSRSIVWA